MPFNPRITVNSKILKTMKRRSKLLIVIFASLAIISCLGAKSVAAGTETRHVTVTAYNSVASQTSDHPWIGAWNNHLKLGEKVIAVSRDLEKHGLTNGTKVKIQGLPGYYTVRDRMNQRYKNHIDVWMGKNIQKARHWGKKDLEITWHNKA